MESKQNGDARTQTGEGAAVLSDGAATDAPEEEGTSRGATQRCDRAVSRKKRSARTCSYRLRLESEANSSGRTKCFEAQRSLKAAVETGQSLPTPWEIAVHQESALPRRETSESCS